MSGSVHSSARAKGLSCAGPGCQEDQCSMLEPEPAGSGRDQVYRQGGASRTNSIAAVASPTVVPQRVRSRSLSAGSSSHRPGQAPLLLGRGPGVEPVAALLEVADDALAVLDGLASSYLNLASTPSTASRTPRLPDSIRPYGAAPGATAAWPPSGWKSASWAVRISALPWGHRLPWVGTRTAPRRSSWSARRPRPGRLPWPASTSGCRRSRRSRPAVPRQLPPGAARPGSAGPGA